MSRHGGWTILALALAPVACAALLMGAAQSPMAAAYAGALMIAARRVLLWGLGLGAGLLTGNPFALIGVTAALTALSLLVTPVFDATGMTGSWLLIAARWNVVLLAGGLGAILRALWARMQKAPPGAVPDGA